MVDVSLLTEKSVLRLEDANKFWIVKNFQIEKDDLTDHTTVVADWYLYQNDKLAGTFKQHRCDANCFENPGYRILINLSEKSLKDYL